MSLPDDTLRLTRADFDAYLPERATSNAFTRPRLELKQRLLAWARGVALRLAELGVAVEIAGSDEHPSLRNGRKVDSQRVFFWRDAAARAEIERLIDRKRSLASRVGDPAPHQSHAFLALRIDSARLEVGVELHPDAWVDVKNLRARLADAALALELTTALEMLPEPFAIGLSGHEARADAQKATSSTVRALLDDGESAGRALWIGWSLPRDVAVAHSAVLDDQLEDAVVALGPIYKLIAWSPDNDRLVLGREVEEARAHAAKVHAEAERDRETWEARRDREARARARDDEARPDAEPFGRESSLSAAPAPSSSIAPETPRRLDLPRERPPLRASVGRRAPTVTEVDPNAPIEKGARVQVLAGPFASKVGVVQELDGRGGARVMLGLLATRIEVKDLIAVAEGKDRPPLASSHRKPLPAR